jgi:SAM-dependent methyltransferase
MTAVTPPVLTLRDPAYFDRLAEVEDRHWWPLGMWRLASFWLDAALAGRKGLRALDVGCGTGFAALGLSGRAEVAEVIALDPSPDALGHARRRLGPPLLRASALGLPVATGSCDLVTCFDVLQHVPPGGDRLAAAEFARVLAPGGWALVRSNGRGWSGDRSAYRLGDLAGILASAGLVVRRASYANCLPALAQELRGRLVRRAGTGPGRSHPSGGGLRIAPGRPQVNRFMRYVSGAEAVLAGRLGVRLPFGHSTLVLAEKHRRDPIELSHII